MRMLGLFGIAALVAVGCTNHEYLGEDGLFAFAITEDTPPFVETEDGNLYIVEERIELPLEAPTAEEMAALSQGVDGLPWARRPWVERGDYELRIDWALINLDDSRRAVDLVVNGINEFHEYMPGFVVDDDEVIPEFAQWERSIVLEPLERRTGTIREEQLDEVAVDLATVVNGVTNANLVVHPDSHSSLDPRVQAFIPEIIPALVGVRVGLRSASPVNVAVELTVRVRDERGILADDPAEAWELPVPEIFEPSSLAAPVE
ncbi:MAG: hypothetical protein KF901_12370 [Myxococcales bacterium]|nr:hypothetical protein [Myxococcales bacterium]